MRFSLSATAALLLHATTTTEATSSSSTTSIINAFEFGRSSPTQRKRSTHRGLVFQTDSTHRMAKTTKVQDAESSTLSEDAKASKKGGYRLMPKSSKVDAAAFSMDGLGSMPAEHVRKPKSVKMTEKKGGHRPMPKSAKVDAPAFSMDVFGSIPTEHRMAKTDKIPFFAALDFSMPITESSMSGDGPDGTGDDSGTGPDIIPPSPTPQDPPTNFHEVVFKYLSVCTGVELEMDCLTSTAMKKLMTQQGGEVTSRARARRFLGTSVTASPTSVSTRGSKSSKQPSLAPSKSVVTSSPTEDPTKAPVTSSPTEDPTKAPVTSSPTLKPTKAPVTPSPTTVDVTSIPTAVDVSLTTPPTVKDETPIPTSIVTIQSTPYSTGQCRPDVTEDDLITILTTSQQECIDSGTPISNDTFQATLSAFLAIFDESNTCWNSFCEESDITSDLFYQILFDQASECADVTLSVDDCILDHILDVVFQPDVSDENGARVRRSLQESCCEPTESDLNFYANYLLLSADAACSELGNVAITNEEWITATESLVKLFGATECWGVDPCEEGDDVVVGQVSSEDVSSEDASSADESDISGSWEPVLPFYDGPVLSDDGKICTFSSVTSDEEVRSLELSFYYQVETTSSESLDLSLIEQALIAEVCDDAGSERRLNELETEVIAVDTSPEDVISEEYTCTSSTAGTNCQVVKGALTILLIGPITTNEDTLLLAKIASLFPLTLNNTDVSSITYLVTPTSTTSASEPNTTASSSTMSAFGISVAATAVVSAALLARGAYSRRATDTTAEEGADDSPQEGYKGQDELTIAATTEMTCASDESTPKHHVLNDEERDNWRDLGMEGDLVTV